MYQDQHDATCVCGETGCDWTREMPSCTNYGNDHPGFSWSIEKDTKATDFIWSWIWYRFVANICFTFEKQWKIIDKILKI